MNEFFRKIWHGIWSTFMNGFFTLLPFTLTIAIFTISFRVIYNWFEPICQIEPTFLRAIPGSHIVLVLLFIFLVGAIIKLFFLQSLIQSIENLFIKIPLLNPVYAGIKQLVQAFSVQDAVTFQKVVLLPFPSRDTLSLGFLTSEVPASIMKSDEKYFNVFVPTTPNPTSGFLVQVKEADIKIIDLTRQEAMSLIISGGIIKPDRFK